MKIFKIIIVAIALLALLGLLGFIINLYSLRKHEISEMEGNLRYLQKNIQTYVSDAKAAHKVEFYPESLDSLVKENYLSGGDLSEVTYRYAGFVTVVYIKPGNTSNKETIIIKAKIDNIIYGNTELQCPIDGPIQRR